VNSAMHAKGLPSKQPAAGKPNRSVPGGMAGHGSARKQTQGRTASQCASHQIKHTASRAGWLRQRR